MGLPFVLAEYDLTTGELTRIIASDGDSHPDHHKPVAGRSFVSLPVIQLSVDPVIGKAPGRSSLKACAQAIQQITGRWPPNVSQ